MPVRSSGIRSLFALAFTAALLGTFTSCAESGPTGPAPTANGVRVGNNFFNPGTRTVSSGTEVTWTWNAGSNTHNVTFDDGPASADQSSGTYARTFNNAGSFPYHCTIHGLGMSGTVTVNP